MQPAGLRFAIPVMRMLVKKLIACFLIFPAGFFATSIFALEVIELAGAAHGSPGLCRIEVQKIADGDSRQCVVIRRLLEMISVKSQQEELYMEQTQLRNQPGLIY